MNHKLITSQEYENLNWEDWDSRHNKSMQCKYGVWRWKGMYENRERLLKIFGKLSNILDVGGGLGPLGFGAWVIDCLQEDIIGRKVFHHTLNDFPLPMVDVIFSSHFLEHVKFIKVWLVMFFQKLEWGGYLILHVPSIRGRKWWHPDVKPEHKRLFALKDDCIEDIKHEVYLDVMIEKWFEIEYASHVGDNSILIIAKKGWA
jgi:hypothetical protein